MNAHCFTHLPTYPQLNIFGLGQGPNPLNVNPAFLLLWHPCRYPEAI